MEQEPIIRISHLIWGGLLFASILVGVVSYQEALKENEALELKLSAVPNIQEFEQQISNLQSERSALQSKVSELNRKVAETNSEQTQSKKGLNAEQDSLASASSENSNLQSEVQALRKEKNALQNKVSELNQKVADTNNVQAQFKKGLSAEQGKLASANSEITKLSSEVQALRGERSALQATINELNQKVAKTNGDKAQFKKDPSAETDGVASANSENTNLSSELQPIGVFDFIIARSDFKLEKCDTYSCNFVSTDNAIKMELKKATLEQHVSKDLNFLLDIKFDSKLFNSSLLVHYYNDKSLIHVYLKGADMTIEAIGDDEISHLQAWLQKVQHHVQ